MKSTYLLAFLVLAASCRATVEAPRTSGRDELAMANGHWEWDRTTIGFGSNQSPATAGYTRQLVFTAEGQVLIGHHGKTLQANPYQLSMGTLAGCGAGQPSSPIISFEPETDFRSSHRSAYRISAAGGTTTLSLEGDYACVDGGSYEEYHWVAD